MSNNPFGAPSQRAAAAAASPVRAVSSPDDDRFTVLVERFRAEQERGRQARQAADEATAAAEALSLKFKGATEEAERAKGAHEMLLKKCRALQQQLREEKEERAKASASWFGGGQAAKDLERCKGG